MGFLNELAKLAELIKGKPQVRLDKGESIRVAKEEEVDRVRRVKETEEARERARERRFEEEKREFEKTRREILEEEKRLKLPEIKKEFEEKVIKEGKQRNQNAAYIAKYFERPGSQNNLNALIESHSEIANIVHELSTGNESVHGDPLALLKLGAELKCEAARAANEGIPGANDIIEPLITAISERASKYLLEAIDRIKESEARHDRVFNEAAWMAQVLNIFKEQAAEILQDPEQITSKVNEFLAEVASEKPIEKLPGETESWIEAGKKPLPEDVTPPEKFISQVNDFWRQAEIEEGKNKLSYKDLNDYQNQLRELEHKAYPAELYVDTEAHNNAIRILHREVEDKLDALARRATQIREREGPSLSLGKMTKEEFLNNIVEPGDFGRGMLRALNSPENKELLDLFLDVNSEEGERFRDQVFLKLHTGVLTYKRQPTQDTFGLYQRGDFDSFISFLKSRLPYRIDKKSGNTVAVAISTHYTNLSDALRISRDMDYNAS